MKKWFVRCPGCGELSMKVDEHDTCLLCGELEFFFMEDDTELNKAVKDEYGWILFHELIIK
jgi:rRNA maturation endonuclease Nob1